MPASTMRVPMSSSRAQRVPEYNGQGALPSVAQTSARFDDSAGAIATAHARSGDNEWKYVKMTADNLMRVTASVDELHERYSKYKAQEAFNAYQEDMMMKKAELDQLQGSNAIGANGGKSVQQLLDEHAQAAKSNLGKGLNDRSRKFFDSFVASEDHKNTAWAIQKQGREFDAYQKSVELGTIQTAYNTAMNDPGQVGNAMGIIQATYEQMGRREGWSPEFTKAKVNQEEQRVLGDMITTRLDANDLAGAGQLMSVYGQKLSPALRMKYTEARGALVIQQAQAMMDAGDFAGARRIMAQNAMFGGNTGGNAYAGLNGQGLGSISARFESGTEGSLAIGYDKHGGTSYGRYQIASGVGGMKSFLNFLKAHGGEAAAIAKRLDDAGPANTGNRSKASGMPAQWVKECEANPQLMDQLQHQYIEQTHYQPALNSLPKELRDMVSNSGPLQEMLWSTAVQHGGGGYNKKKQSWVGAAGIFRRVWRDGMTPQELAEAVYKARGGDFGSSTEQVQEAVNNRFKDEKGMVLAALGGMPAPATGEAATAPVPVGEQSAPGQRPVYSLGSPALDARASHFMKNLDKAERAQRIEDVGKNVFEATKGLRGQDREAVAMQQIEAQVSDPEERVKVFSAFKQQASFDDDMTKAKDGFAARQVVEKAIKDNVAPLTFLQQLNANKELSQEAKEMAMERFNGKIKETPQTRFALDQLYKEIDRNPEMTMDAIEAYGVNNRLTTDQINKARSYKENGGKMSGLKMSTVENLWKRISGDKKMPDGLYDQLVSMVPDGKKPTEQDLAKIMANLGMDGESENTSWYVPGYGDNETYREAVKNGRADKWLPDISSKQEREEIEGALKNAGATKITDELVRKYKKKFIMGL